MRLYETLEKDEIDSIGLRTNSFRVRIGLKKDSSKALRKENKLLIYSNYERLLGGELFHIENAFNKKLECYPRRYKESYDLKEPLANLIHHHEINIKNLRGLYQYAIYGKIDGVRHKNLDKNMAFRICEFFLLTIYIYHNKNEPVAYYRSRGHCYYDNFPHEILDESDNIAVYNSSSILFNAVKYYNFFKQYCKLMQEIKSKVTEEKDASTQNDSSTQPEKSWLERYDDFWTQIIDHKDNSLIYKIIIHNDLLYQQMINDPDNKFQNENLERIFIRNMDIHNYLQDCLPLHAGTIEKKENIELLNRLIQFYKRLFKFEFYIYPKKENGEDTSYNLDIFEEVYNFLIKLKGDAKAKETFMDIFILDTKLLEDQTEKSEMRVIAESLEKIAAAIEKTESLEKIAVAIGKTEGMEKIAEAIAKTGNRMMRRI